MNTQYARLEEGRLKYAPKALVTPQGVTVNPSRMTYLDNGWKFLDIQPPADPPEGKEYVISGYTETATDIQAVFKLVPVVLPPRTFSKLRLINALMSRNLWPAVRDWLDASGYYDLFVAAQDFREDHPQFAAALAAARTRFSLPGSEIASILAESIC